MWDANEQTPLKPECAARPRDIAHVEPGVTVADRCKGRT